MMILLQVSSVEHGGEEVIFHDHFQRPNINLNKKMNSPR
jgi:hypothetical protein